MSALFADESINLPVYAGRPVVAIRAGATMRQHNVRYPARLVSNESVLAHELIQPPIEGVAHGRRQIGHRDPHMRLSIPFPFPMAIGESVVHDADSRFSFAEILER